MTAPPKIPPPPGLPGLRRGGTLAELLLLYDCLTEESTTLEPIARRLGVTSQAVSHSFRRLTNRGLIEVRNGRYRATVLGVAWVHQVLDRLAEDVFARQQRLHIVRTTRALARSPIRRGEEVALELVDGTLSAHRGRTGGSTGRAVSDARKGALVEVGELSGILPIPKATIRVLSIPSEALGDPRLSDALRREIAGRTGSVVATFGLEADQITPRSADRPVLRFAAAPTCLEAARVGVSSTLVVLDRDLPTLLAQFPTSGGSPTSVETLRLDPDRPPQGRANRGPRRR